MTEPDLTYLEQMILNGHDPGRALDLSLAAATQACADCHEVQETVPDGQGGWVVTHSHEPHCPQHEDNQAAAEVDLSGLESLSEESVLRGDHDEELRRRIRAAMDDEPNGGEGR